MSEFNVLGYLQVSVSNASPQTIPQSSTTTAVLTPRVKPPQPGGPIPQSTVPVPRTAPPVPTNTTGKLSAFPPSKIPQPSTAQNSPTPRRHVEVFEGAMPSNVALNQAMAEQRRLQRMKEKEQELNSAAADRQLVNIAQKEEVETKIHERETVHRDWDSYRQQVLQQREEHRLRVERQREEEKHLIAEAQDAAAREAQYLRDQKVSLSHQLRSQLQEEIERKAAIRKEHAELERQRLYNATLVDAKGIQKDLEAERHQQEALRHAWEEQRKIREATKEAQARTEAELIAGTIRQAAEKAAYEAAEREKAKQQKNALRQELEEQIKRKNAERERTKMAQREAERQYTEEQKAAARRLQEEQLNKVYHQKESLREGISRQLEDKASTRRQREVAEVVPLVSESDTKVFVKCPVTGRLLPPEYFNMTAASVRATLKRIS